MPDSITLNKKYIVAIAGPTASGKTGLAIQLASLYKADIFSADSRQIYKEISIGTAKPSHEEMMLIKHHFIDIFDVSATYAAGQYVADINVALENYFKNHDIAILVGGTGLYIKAFLEGLDELPEVDPEINKMLKQKYQESGITCLQDMLLASDPEYYASADVHNPHRLIRALGVSLTTGQPFSSYLKQQPKKGAHNFEVIGIVLDPEREALYQAINQRVDAMIVSGLEDEAKKMVQFRDLQALQTVGYKEFFDYFDGKLTKDEAISLIKQNSRRYAKRQVTWFKKYGLGKRFVSADFSAISSHINEMLNK
ncbi:MAG: tRNA (adenosine(37)-N6)-dimethylallyltransferase MiaA [Saprospiraceae bacterium]|nr:tRNA (adenosine(37)-N6)-dimethylallyltransferase MiaA [Saprospiraceae bacterium]